MQSNIYAAINTVVNTYVTGMLRGDADALRRAFHPKAQIIGRVDGQEWWGDLAAFIAECESGPLPVDAAIPAYTIESIQLAGDTAVVRCVNLYQGRKYRDTLNLLRGPGGWSIVAKLFQTLE